MQRLFKTIILVNLLIGPVNAQTIDYFKDGRFLETVNFPNKYRRSFQAFDGGHLIETYISDTLINKGKFYGFDSSDEINKYFYYYLNDQYYMPNGLRIEGRDAIITFFKKDGRESEVVAYDEEGIKYNQIWDADGNEILNNGNGQWRVSKDENTIVRNYQDFKRIDFYTIRHNKGDTVYREVDKAAYHQDGFEAFQKELGKVLRYPGIAQVFGKEADLFVQFTVKKDGVLDEFEITNKEKLGYNFEKKTLKRVQKLSRWNPAIKNGKPVKTRFGFQIKYRLH